MRKNRIKMLWFCCGLLFLSNQVIYALNTRGVTNTSEISCELYIDLLKSLLIPYISKGVNDYYADIEDSTHITSYDLFDLAFLNIKQLDNLGQYYFEFVIEVHTFQGAHNPPYATDIITFREDFSGIHVVEYKHFPE